MDVHLRNLRYFVAVAEELHFTRAAERMRVSQPALSKQVRQLERELGFPLFRRDRRRVALTEAGEALLPQTRRLLANWDTSLGDAAARASEEAKILRIGFQTSVAGGLYQTIAARFAQRRPEWRIVFNLHAWSDPTAGLLDGTADVAFLWLPTGAEAALELWPVRSERRVAILPQGHRLARRRTLRMADLTDEPFVALPESAGPLRDYWLALERREGRPVRIGAEARTPDETFEAVAAGHGVHLLAEGNAVLYARSGIVSRPVVDLEPCELAVACRRGDRRLAVRELIARACEVALQESHADQP